jgi:hypothetical protein
MGAIVVIVIALGLIALYIWGIVLFFQYVALYVFGLGGLAMTGAVFVNYFRALGDNLFWGTGWSDGPNGPEPAFRQYFFRKAFYDYSQIVRLSHKRNMESVQWVINTGTKSFKNSGALFTWPLGVVFYAIAAVSFLPAAVAYAAFGVIHLLLIVALCGVVLGAAIAVRFIEYALMLWRRIFLACPSCYKKFGLPIYNCPGCAAVHKALVPGTYGIFRRRCVCGRKLPTLFLFGRNELPGFCPHCSKPLSASIGTIRNIHIPVVGGPAAGKTSFLMANMVELRTQANTGDLTLNFPEKRDERLFDACRTAFSTGSLLAKTAEYSPNAFLASVGDTDRNNVLLYLYDAAGELFQSSDTLRLHEYYSYTHGILFLIDPFSLPSVQVELGHLIRPAVADIKPCEERPQDVYDRIVGMLRTISKNGSFGSQPLAVVVTKVDAFGLEARIRPPAERVLTFDAKVAPEDGRSRATRQWLVDQGEGNLVRSMEHDFKTIRYFYCSALGHIPSGRPMPFVPKGVLDPLAWTLGSYGVRLNVNARSARA